MTTKTDILSILEDNTTFGFNEIRLGQQYHKLIKQEAQLENTIQLFAFGTIEQYLTNESDFINLSDAALKKLRKLSLISYALEGNFYTYKDLLEKLALESQNELERLIVQSNYDGILEAKLYNKEGYLRISSSTGRDVLLEGEDDSGFGAKRVSDLIADLDTFAFKIHRAFDYLNEVDKNTKENDEEFEELNSALEQQTQTQTQRGKRLSNSASSNAPVPSEAQVSQPVVSEVNASSKTRMKSSRKRKIGNK